MKICLKTFPLKPRTIKTFLSLLFLSPFLANAVIVEQILAIVNSEIITMTDVNIYRERLKTGGLIDNSLIDANKTKLFLSDKKALIQHLIDEKIMDSEVKRLQMSLTIEDLEKEIRKISKRENMSREQLKAGLEQRGIVFSEYQDFLKTSLERRALIEREITSKIKITEEDISDYYIKVKGPNSSQVFEYKIAHILFLPDKVSGAKGAIARAQKVLEKLKGGNVTFAKLASQYSEDSDFVQGGVLGTFKKGEMIQPLENAVKTLEPGDFSGVVKTPAGFHILKLLKRKLVADPAFESRKNEIRNALFFQEFKKQIRNWLDRKRKVAFIKIN